MEKYQFTEQERALMERARMPFAVFQYIDLRMVPLILSDGFCEMFGYKDRAEAYLDMENDVSGKVHPDDVSRFEEAAKRFIAQGGRYEVIYRTKHRSGGYHIVHAVGEHVVKESGVRLASVWFTDEGPYGEGSVGRDQELNQSLYRALHEESILKANYYDYLTGLPSMTYFFELAEAGRSAIAKDGGETALLFIDLSGMKYFNRKYGFAEGDKLLRAFTKVLVQYFSNENCSRFGQDHFVVLTRSDNLETTLSQLFQECQTLNGGRTLPVRVGIYLDQAEGVDISIACDRAKLACDSMRNSFVSAYRYFDSAMQGDMDRQRYIIDTLDQAIAEGWIKVYYQPIVRAVNGKVCDEEALARWIDPVKGFLSPADFIPILEEARLIYRLDLHIVDQVLEKLKVQRAAGLHIVPQSINLSRADFDVCDIVEEIRRRVDDAGIDRDKLTIEITESIIGSDFEFMKEQVCRFRDLGFPVWMDDFGSGYSSLDVLQSIQFNLIKFDMRFMQQFNQGDSGKIILTELMKMATALDIDTVCEGVETEEQVRFLQEIGCSKLQGFYFARPMPLEHILERYRTGTAIGFENPAEASYYDSIGRVNLYDLGVIAREEGEEENTFQDFFNTLPMAILEVQGDHVRFVRSNPSYRDFMKRAFGFNMVEDYSGLSAATSGHGKVFWEMIKRCCQSGKRLFVNEKLADESIVHSFIRRIAVNPVTGTAAVAVAVLSIAADDPGTTYANIARALAADYVNLFYVNLDTEKFIEYSSGVGEEEIAMERHGTDFFEASRRDALKILYPEDQEGFRAAFTRENVVRTLDTQGTFTLNYRQFVGGVPMYMVMKIMRMHQDGNYIIIGVSNIDDQMKQQASQDRIRQERLAFSRIATLSDGFICMYIVNPKTNEYSEYIASKDYENLGVEKVGEDFFATSLENGKRTVYEKDWKLYARAFTRDNVLREIREKGIFTLNYRLKIDETILPVRLRAALVHESDGDKLLIGMQRTEGSKQGSDEP